MTVVDLWVNALSGKAAAAFLGQAGNEGIPELLGGDLSASSTLQHLLVTMDKSGVDVGVMAAGIAAEETGPLLDEVAAHPDRLRVAVNVAAMLIAFIGLIALLNGIVGGVMGWFGHRLGGAP